MDNRRSGKDRRVRDTTDRIDAETIRKLRETQEYKAVPKLPATVTMDIPVHIARFLVEESEREGLNINITAGILFAKGIQMIKQVRTWRENHPFIVAKETDNYYGNVADDDYRRER